MLEPEVFHLDDKGIRLQLPATCQEINRRRNSRHPVENVTVQFIQNSVVFSGRLVTFIPGLLEIHLTPESDQNLMWINTTGSVTVILQSDGSMLYSGECHILKEIEDQGNKRFLLKPDKKRFMRFEPKMFRNTRQKLVPSPTVIFRHPFTGKIVNLMVFDIAAGGLSVEESSENAVLLPGMIIPEVQLDFAGNRLANFKAQVIYRKENDSELNVGQVDIRCGLAVLDMSIEDHSRLVALLHNATNKNFFLSDRFDPEELWNFFFDSGFIYPRKYSVLASNKKKIKAVYEKLYTTTPSIAKHFVYRNTKQILGHMAMIRAYSHSWLIHHHAANTSVSKIAGLAVLNQVGRFINDTLRLHSALMQYVFCYFRPENRFPSRVFGGAAKSIGNLKGCSVDTLAYAYLPNGAECRQKLPAPWHIDKARHNHLKELEYFYEKTSGGLMLDALDLKSDSDSIDELSTKLASAGLRREKKLFSLKMDGALKAIIMVNISDTGLNLSELTNGIQIFFVEQRDVTRGIIHSLIYELGMQYYEDGFSVLIYPDDFAKEACLFSGHEYNMWILNAEYSDQYFKHLGKLLRFIQY